MRKSKIKYILCVFSILVVILTNGCLAGIDRATNGTDSISVGTEKPDAQAPDVATTKPGSSISNRIKIELEGEELEEVITKKFQSELPDSAKILNNTYSYDLNNMYRYYAWGGSLYVKISFSEEEFDEILQKVETVMGKRIEKDNFLGMIPPHYTNVAPWWDMNNGKILYFFGHSYRISYEMEINGEMVEVRESINTEGYIVDDGEGQYLLYLAF